MPTPIATPNLHSNTVSSSQLGDVFEPSSEDEQQDSINGGDTPGDRSLSTDSSISTVSTTDKSSNGEDPSSPLYASDHTVRSHVPPNTPKKASSQASRQECAVGDAASDNDSGTSASETRIRRLSDELHAVLAPCPPSPNYAHTNAAAHEHAPVPNGNAYLYVQNTRGYHMHYREHHRQDHAAPTPPFPGGFTRASATSSQYHTAPCKPHNLCPTSFDRVDSWRILVDTLDPSPIPSPMMGTPPEAKRGPKSEADSGEVSPLMLVQKLNELSDEMQRAPRGDGPPRERGRVRGRGGRDIHAHDGHGAQAHGHSHVQRGRGDAPAGEVGARGREGGTTAGSTASFDRHRKEILKDLAQLAEDATGRLDAPSSSTSSRGRSRSRVSPSSHPNINASIKHNHNHSNINNRGRRGGRGVFTGTGTPSHSSAPRTPSGTSTPAPSRPGRGHRYDEDANWVAPRAQEGGGGLELDLATLGFHGSSRYTADAQGDAPVPRFLGSLFE